MASLVGFCRYEAGAMDRANLINNIIFLCFRARDRTDKVGGIEIYDVRDYQQMRCHWNGAGLIIHELCHLIHQHCLFDGLFNGKVVQAYEMAKKSGLYDTTLRRDWAFLECESDLAYAMIDHKVSVCIMYWPRCVCWIAHSGTWRTHLFVWSPLARVGVLCRNVSYFSQ